MNWNNDKLNEIQAIEYQLIANPSGASILFTSLIHKTKMYNNPSDKDLIDYNKLDINQIKKFTIPQTRTYKHHFVQPSCMKEITDDIAKYIQNGNNLNVACILSGYNYNVLRPKFTNEHKAKFKQARELKYNTNQ